MTMKKVGVAELKARLSQYLRVVRRGQSITVLDRDTPIAQIVPFSPSTPLSVRPQGSVKLHEVKLPAPLGLEDDIVDLLLEERQVQR